MNTTHIRAGRVPASAPPPRAGGLLDFPGPNTPEARKAISALRKAARDEIERLLAFLDRTEDDHDLEDGGDAEPWLGWPGLGRGAAGWGEGRAIDAGDDDRELDDVDDEDGGDREADHCDDEDGGDIEEDDAERGMPI